MPLAPGVNSTSTINSSSSGGGATSAPITPNGTPPSAVAANTGPPSDEESNTIGLSLVTLGGFAAFADAACPRMRLTVLVEPFLVEPFLVEPFLVEPFLVEPVLLLFLDEPAMILAPVVSWKLFEA